MKLQIKRNPNAEATPGTLYVDGARQCDTLEDIVRNGVKVYGETAIPNGTYDVVLSWSPRFQCVLPLIADVPGFVGVRIHPGNTTADTEGCVLVGEADGNYLKGGTSRPAFNALMALLEPATYAGDPITLEITDET